MWSVQNYLHWMSRTTPKLTLEVIQSISRIGNYKINLCFKTSLCFYVFKCSHFDILTFHAFTFSRFTSLRLCVFASLRLCVFTSLLLYVFTSLRLYVFTSLRRYVVTSLRRYVVTSLRLYVFTFLRLYVFLWYTPQFKKLIELHSFSKKRVLLNNCKHWKYHNI